MLQFCVENCVFSEIGVTTHLTAIKTIANYVSYETLD